MLGLCCTKRFVRRTGIALMRVHMSHLTSAKPEPETTSTSRQHPTHASTTLSVQCRRVLGGQLWFRVPGFWVRVRAAEQLPIDESVVRALAFLGFSTS